MFICFDCRWTPKKKKQSIKQRHTNPFCTARILEDVSDWKFEGIKYAFTVQDDMDAPVPQFKFFPEGGHPDISDEESSDSIGGPRESTECGRLTSMSSSLTPQVTCKEFIDFCLENFIQRVLCSAASICSVQGNQATKRKMHKPRTPIHRIHKRKYTESQNVNTKHPKT
jgi:hypothetical protein